MLQQADMEVDKETVLSPTGLDSAKQLHSPQLLQSKIITQLD
jgi:hypothetical protein